MTDHIVEIAEISATDPARFETGVIQARPHFLAARGCLGLALHRVIETLNTYRLEAKWRTVEDQMVAFRASEGFQAWRAAMSQVFAGSPVVTHSRIVDLG